MKYKDEFYNDVKKITSSLRIEFKSFLNMNTITKYLICKNYQLS